MTDQAATFRKMAERIELNKENGFGGAFVICPPGDEAKSLETLILDPTSNPASFWGLLRAKADMALAELDAAERNKQAGFGRR
jgi:ABC-type proline/glycine betaine transport system substrate-binding protein